MLDRFKKYAAKLERLSNQELDRSAEQLVFGEKRNLAKVIAHVAEMSRRKAALQLGYKSLFADLSYDYEDSRFVPTGVP